MTKQKFRTLYHGTNSYLWEAAQAKGELLPRSALGEVVQAIEKEFGLEINSIQDSRKPLNDILGYGKSLVYLAIDGDLALTFSGRSDFLESVLLAAYELLHPNQMLKREDGKKFIGQWNQKHGVEPTLLTFFIPPPKRFLWSWIQAKLLDDPFNIVTYDRVNLCYLVDSRKIGLGNSNAEEPYGFTQNN